MQANFALKAPAWLRSYRTTAAQRLIPEAMGKPGRSRDAAEHVLRWLARDREDGVAAVTAAIEAYTSQNPTVRDAMAQVMSRDPLAQYPRRSPHCRPGSNCRC